MDKLLKPLEDVADEARQLEAEINTAIDEQDARPEPRERKMRFAPDTDAPNSDVFVKRGMKRQYSFEELALGRMLLHARGEVLPDEMESRFQQLAREVVKYTMTTGGAGTGAELTDTINWGRLFEDIHSQTLVADLFRPWIEMSTGTMELSEMGDAIFYKPGGEGESVESTDLTTAKRTLTAYTLKAQVDISDEEAEDAIIGMLATIRATLIRNAKEVIDEVVLNADASTGSTNINSYDSDIASSSRHLVGFDGLIHYCLNEVTGQASGLTTLEVADFATLISALGKYADNPGRCAFIFDRWTKNKAIQLDDFRTVDKLGDKATLLRGQIGQVYGVPCIMSGQLAKSDANGRIDGATPGNNTKGRLLLVNRDMWKVGMRRSIRVAAERDESKGITSLVATMRLALQCLGDRSSSDYCHTALGYNITV